MSQPMISILIPVFNRVDLIEQTVACALSQNYLNFEVVIVDNASTDESWSLLKTLYLNNPQVRLYRNDSNVGPVRNWLKCVEAAEGEYAKILWSDDLITPDFLSKTVNLITPEVGFVFTQARVFTTNLMEGKLCHDLGVTRYLASEEFIIRDLAGLNTPLSPGCAIFRLSDMKECLLLDIPNPISSDFSMHAIGNDLLLFLLVAKRYRLVGYVGEPLAYFRAHEGSISVASGPGELPVHYNLARAYFVLVHRPDLIKKLNARLYIDCLRYPDFKNYKISKFSDFYLHSITVGVSTVFMMIMLFKRIWIRISTLVVKLIFSILAKFGI